MLGALVACIAVLLGGCAGAEVAEPPFDAMSGSRFVRVEPGEVPRVPLRAMVPGLTSIPQALTVEVF